MLEPLSICLTALYLRGLPRPVQPVRRRWPRVISLLRSADCGQSDFPSVLRRKGFMEEAAVLESDGILDSATSLFNEKDVLTALCDGYPRKWLEVLKEGAPPVLWLSGVPPLDPLLGIVGSRSISPEIRNFAQGVGAESIRLGYSVLSGGATGSDLAGAKGAIQAGGRVLELVPYGIHRYVGIDKCGLSLCSPDDEFSTANAMERNALIYAAADRAVIVHSRFKEGGTWYGAFEAVRRKLCPLVVRDDNSAASRALIGLGCTAIGHPTELEIALRGVPIQKGLFNIG